MKSRSFGRFAAAAALACGSLILGSCAPRQSPASLITASTAANSVSFYPHETGLIWNYLPEGDTSRDIPYVLSNLGPTVFRGQPVIASALTGRGADQTWYRVYDSSGVRLLGIRKPGVNIALDPAWQEAPPESAWRVGLSWSGSSQVVITDDAGKEQAKGTLDYRYDVQDQRTVTVPGGTYRVWVVTRQIKDTVGGLFPAAQQYWFTPYTGDVRTTENLLLTGRNFAPAGGRK